MVLRGTQYAVFPSLDIVHLVTKPVVDADFLQDWLSFLRHEQEFAVHLLYTDEAFSDSDPRTLNERFPGVKLHRIEKVTKHGAKDQAFVFLADYLDLKYLSGAIHPALVHSHDTRSLLLARLLFPHSIRLHSWWLEDRNAHRLWRVTVERLADFRTWETVETEAEEQSQAMSALQGRHIPLPTPVTLSEKYERGDAFTTIRELYRNILKETDLRARARL